MLVMIAEAPGDRSRLARIRKVNENGILKMKAGAPALYDQVQAAMTGRA